MEKKRIFIGMHEIAGYYGQLAQGFREKGYIVTFIGGNNHKFAYEQSKERPSYLILLYEKITSLRVSTPQKRLFSKLLYITASNMVRFLLFCWAILKFDAFIFGFGSSLLPKNLDLPLLRFFKKHVICNLAHGSDARPSYINGAYLKNNGESLDVETLAKLTKKIKERCEFIARYAEVLIGAPLTSHFFSTSFIDWFQIGVPNKIKQISDIYRHPDETIRILHCPSHPQAKGTPRIREAIRSLKQKGYNIQLVEIIGQPNRVVLRELSNCDFVIDQLYSDTPMAGFATEAAWFGKPSVVGGYGWDILKKQIPEDMFPPSKICHPEGVEEAIEQLVTDETYRRELGERARRFVQEQWSQQHVAVRYIRLLDGDIPEEWFSNPKEIVYLHGCGLPEERTKEITRDLILSKGVKALQLAEKPVLERAFVEFVGLDPDAIS